MKRIFRRFLRICCISVVIGAVCFFSAGNFIYNYALVRDSVFSRENIIAFFTGKPVDNSAFSGTEKEKLNWLERNSEEKQIVSDDGLSLHGYFAENPDGGHNYAVICHGYSGDGTTMSYYAKRLYNMGMSVLCPDARASGESEGNVRGMGYLEKRDIILWIKEITKADPQAEVLLFGVSMGGATVLFTSGEKDLPSCVKAVISDCAYTNVYKQIGNVIRLYIPFMPDFPLVYSASLVCKIRAGFSFQRASCVKAVKSSVTPTLFIHGSEDTYVPFYMLDKLYKSAACPKEKLVVEGAAHARSAKKNPELYWSTVEKFVGKYINL